MDLGADDGDAHAVGDADVTVGVREPTDQAVVAELAQVVGHLAGGVDAAEQSGDQDAQVPVSGAGRGNQCQA